MRGKDVLVTLFVLAAVLLSWPLLTVVNHSRPVLGVPTLVLYLFAVWAGIIVVLFWFARRAEPSGGAREPRNPR